MSSRVALLEALSVTTFAVDGDVEGHEFHGNQWQPGSTAAKAYAAKPGVGNFCKAMLCDGHSPATVAAAAQKKFGGKTSAASVSWYQSQMKKDTPGGKALAEKKVVIAEKNEKAVAAVPKSKEPHAGMTLAEKQAGFNAATAGKAGMMAVKAGEEYHAKVAAAEAAAEAVGTKVGGLSLTSEHVAAISAYTGNAYRALNAAHREGKPLTEAQAKTTACLDEVIAHSVVKEPTVLYRGFAAGAAQKMFGPTVNLGDTIRDPGFVSTSRNASTAHSFAGGKGVVLKIEVPAGAKARDVQWYSSHASEHEVVLPRGSKFKVVGVETPTGAGSNLIVRVQHVA